MLVLQGWNFSGPHLLLLFFAMTETFFYSQMQSPIGVLLLAASEKGLYRVQFGPSLPTGSKNGLWSEAPEKIRECEEELRAYFRSELREFTVRLDLRGTPFQLRCWEALRRIPYGETRSYKELAESVGSPRAFRAVGQANHNNPIAIIVPCHRVIGADSTLTGYGGGLNVKEKLLQLEGGHPQGLLTFARESV